MIFRGAIHELKAMPGTRGREQQGHRYAVVIQSDQFATSLVTVAMTSTSAVPTVYRPEIELDGKTTRILTDQIYSVDPTSRFGDFKGALEARQKVGLKMNIQEPQLKRLIDSLPALRNPTISKLSTEGWVAVVKPGRVMFEVEGVEADVARLALERAAAKLPVRTKFVRREER